MVYDSMSRAILICADDRCLRLRLSCVLDIQKYRIWWIDAVNFAWWWRLVEQPRVGVCLLWPRCNQQADVNEIHYRNRTLVISGLYYRHAEVHSCPSLSFNKTDRPSGHWEEAYSTLWSTMRSQSSNVVWTKEQAWNFYQSVTRALRVCFQHPP